jgi:hypothetical protein
MSEAGSSFSCLPADAPARAEPPDAMDDTIAAIAVAITPMTSLLPTRIAPR